VIVLVTAPIMEPLTGVAELHLGLGLAAAAAAAAAAILGDIAARVSGDTRSAWIGAAVALYCLVVLPSTTLWPHSGSGDVVIGTARVTGFLIVTVALLAALRPPAKGGPGVGWVATGAGVTLMLAAVEVAALFPTALPGVLAPGALSRIILLAWCGLALAGMVIGYRRDSLALTGIFLGLATLAAAHLYRIVAGLAVRQADLVFDGVRLLGLLVVLTGMIKLTTRGVRTLHSEQLRHQEELRIASVHIRRAGERAQERDHELRNGLAVMSGITQLLSAPVEFPEREQLRAAVLRELARLAQMIDSENPPSDGHGYDVGRVLRDLVVVRRATGASISLELSPDLRAMGTPAVLAQVVTNLLANCARHAPASPVRIRAGPCGSRTIVEVSDDGRGLPPGQESLVLERGVRHPSTGGSGLGLHVSRQLLDSEGGVIRFAPNRNGCTAVVELRRAPTEIRHSENSRVPLGVSETAPGPFPTGTPRQTGGLAS